MSFKKYTSDEFQYAQALSSLIQDCTQEGDRIKDFLPKFRNEYEKKHPGEAVPDNLSDAYLTRFNAAVEKSDAFKMAPTNYNVMYSDLCKSIKKGTPVQKALIDQFRVIFLYMTQAKYNNVLVNAPENAEKSIDEILDFNSMLVSGEKLGRINYEQKAEKLLKRIKDDKYFAEKFAVAMLDGSLEENFDVSFDFSKNGQNACSIDCDKLGKYIDNKPVAADLFTQNAQKEYFEKRQAQMKDSAQKAAKTLNTLSADGKPRDPQHWGIPREAHKNYEIRFSAPRGMLEALAFAMMVNDGYSLDGIFDTDKQAQREKYGKRAVELVEASEAKEIFNQFVSADEKCGSYMESVISKIGDLTLEKYLSDDFRNVRKTYDFVMDFSQESEAAFKYLQAKKDDFINKHPDESVPEKLKVMEESEYKNRMGKSLSAAMVFRPYVASIASLYDELCVQCSSVQDAASTCCRSLFGAKAARKYISELLNAPENSGKPIYEIIPSDGEEFVIISMLDLGRGIPGTENFLERVKEDKDFAEKFVMSALDGSFEKQLNISYPRSKKDVLSYVHNGHGVMDNIDKMEIDRSVFDNMPIKPKKTDPAIAVWAEADKGLNL